MGLAERMRGRSLPEEEIDVVAVVLRTSSLQEEARAAGKTGARGLMLSSTRVGLPARGLPSGRQGTGQSLLATGWMMTRLLREGPWSSYCLEEVGWR